MEDIATYGEKALALTKEAMIWVADKTGKPLGTVIIVVAVVVVVYKFAQLYFGRKG